MDAKTYSRLSLMMFLQFFVWGAWFVTLGTHLGSIGFTGSQIGYTYLMNNIGAIISPFFVGMAAAAGVDFIGDVQHADGVSWQHFHSPDGTVLEIIGPGNGARG